jgi:hypothetical protein
MPLKLIALLLALAGLAGLVSVVIKKWAARPTDTSAWPFYKKKPLSAVEQTLYHRLVAALPGQIVLAQVQVSRVLGVKKGSNFGHWNNRINRMSYDFVVCAKDSSVLAAIELDDKSHDTAVRAEADQRKDRATEAAGIRLIRWQARSLPDQAAIRAALAQAPEPQEVAAQARRPNERSAETASSLDFKNSISPG